MDDIRALSGPAFFRFAFRLGAYQGVIQARLMEQEQGQEPAPSESVWGDGGSMQRAPRGEVNPGTRQSLEALQAQLPGAPQLFSFATATRAEPGS